jgi:hypothetical protein
MVGEAKGDAGYRGKAQPYAKALISSTFHINGSDCLENSGFAVSRQAPPFSRDTPKAQKLFSIRGDLNLNYPKAQQKFMIFFENLKFRLNITSLIYIESF